MGRAARGVPQRGIRIMGDLPIYVAHDSADVWTAPQLFWLDERGNPLKVAGVPPDYFSATGQLWGNPIYRWERLRADGFRWWMARVRGVMRLFDMVRIDHFRGFEAYFEIPAGETTAVNGTWIKGPGVELFEALEREFGELPIVAENLGKITPEVEAIRQRFDFPGMAILQFAFGTDPQGPSFRPHNYERNLVAYHRRTRQRHDRGLVDERDRRLDAQRRGSAPRTGVCRLVPEFARRRDPVGDDSRADGLGGRHRADSDAGRAGTGQPGAHEPARTDGRQLEMALRARAVASGDGAAATGADRNCMIASGLNSGWHGGEGLASHAEKSWGGLVMRTCHTVGEFRQVVALQKEVWGFEDIELIPARLFVVGEKIGGHVLGAYDGATLVAFAFGLPGVRDRHAYIHSHMLAVKETHRNCGLGREMKLFQRELAMSEGYDLIEWTFDPLEIKNAFFNWRSWARWCGATW